MLYFADNDAEPKGRLLRSAENANYLPTQPFWVILLHWLGHVYRRDNDRLHMQLLSFQLKAGKRCSNKNHEGEEIKSHIIELSLH